MASEIKVGTTTYTVVDREPGQVAIQNNNTGETVIISESEFKTLSTSTKK